LKAAALILAGLVAGVASPPALALADPGQSNPVLGDYTHPDPQDRPPNVAYHPSAEDPYDNVPGFGPPIGRPCSREDRACIDKVSAEAWRRYPTQMATLCERETVVRNDEGFNGRRLGIADPAGVLKRPSPQTEALCQYGAQHGLASR
jgi:hypothetical protein